MCIRDSANAGPGGVSLAPSQFVLVTGPPGWAVQVSVDVVSSVGRLAAGKLADHIIENETSAAQWQDLLVGCARAIALVWDLYQKGGRNLSISDAANVALSVLECKRLAESLMEAEKVATEKEIDTRLVGEIGRDERVGRGHNVVTRALNRELELRPIRIKP